MPRMIVLLPSFNWISPVLFASSFSHFSLVALAARTQNPVPSAFVSTAWYSAILCCGSTNYSSTQLNCDRTCKLHFKLKCKQNRLFE